MLQPGQRISKLIQELIPEAANQAGGFIWVRSDVPVFLTSLFGNISGVLANIPPQPVPRDFRPDRGRATLRVSPPLAVLTPGAMQQLLLDGTMADPVWSVNGNEGGNSITGTISAAGVLSAPSSAPSPLPVTVTARAANQTAGVSVDVLSRQLLLGDLGVVQSVAYLAGLQRLYTSELAGSVAPLGIALRHGSPPGFDSTIFDVTSAPRQKIADFTTENIPKMVPFVGVYGREYLLLAASTSGRIIRLDPENQQITDVASGLDAPAAIAINSLTSELLVAEANQIRTITALELNRGLLVAASVEAAQPIRQGVILGELPASGIAADQCSGDIYLSDATTGQILVIEREMGASQPAVAGLDLPGQMLGLNRRGVSCSQSFHLLVVERGPGRISLVTPFDGSVVPWLPSPGGNDLACLPFENVFSANQSVLFGEVVGTIGQLVTVDVPGLYVEEAQNPEQAVQDPAPATGVLLPGVYYLPLVLYGIDEPDDPEDVTSQTSLTFHNASNAVASVTVDFLDAAGGGLPLDFGSGPQTSLPVELVQGAVFTTQTSGSVTPLREGYARMTVAGAEVFGEVVIDLIGNDSVSTVRVPALSQATRFFSLALSASEDVDELSLIVLNPDQAASATITARLFDGAILASAKEIDVGPLNWSNPTIAGGNRDLFTDSPELTFPSATVTLESSRPVFFSFILCGQNNSCQIIS